MVNVILTSTAEHLKEGLQKAGINPTIPEKNRDGKRTFPDGEVYVRIPGAQGMRGRTVVVHSGMPDPNGGLMELEMILELLSRNRETGPIEVFFTYFPYGMQDSVFEHGELNTAESLVKKLTGYYGVKRIYVIDAHFLGRDWVKNYPVRNISALDMLTQAAERDFPGIVNMAPDIGCQRRTGLSGTEKLRTNSFTAEIRSGAEFRAAVEGGVVGAVDDLLETGGTMDRFREECIRCGARDVVAMVTHGVLPEGIERVMNRYTRLYLTNSINRPEANVDITGLVLDAVLNGE